MITRKDFLKLAGSTIFFPFMRYVEYHYLWCVGCSILGGGFTPDSPYTARAIIKSVLSDRLQVGTLPGGHDCHDGYRTDQLAQGVLSWATQIIAPDLVWIYAGPNDVLQSYGYAMSLLVNNVRSVLPRAHIVVSRIGPVADMIDETHIFNVSQIDTLRNVDVVDYEDCFQDCHYEVDHIHLNDLGQAVLAQEFINSGCWT